MAKKSKSPVNVLLVAIPETAGSALYGMLDVLLAAGNLWQVLVHEDESVLFQVRIVAAASRAFTCGNGIPVKPQVSLKDNPEADIIILPEIWLGPDEDFRGRHSKLISWIKQQYKQGASVYSACSGAIMLAETGLLDGCDATSHWGYEDMFRKNYPAVRFQPEPNLVFADIEGRIVTAGGTTSWHDLALHIISRYASPGEALRIAKVYLLKWHGEGQLPFASLTRNTPHNDALVRRCENWLSEHYKEDDVIRRLTSEADASERTLKRRFKSATGVTLIEYQQNLRIEEAKRLLEKGQLPVDEISVAVGYKDRSFFRSLFKRRSGLTPSQYRRMFQPLLSGLSSRA